MVHPFTLFTVVAQRRPRRRSPARDARVPYTSPHGGNPESQLGQSYGGDAGYDWGRPRPDTNMLEGIHAKMKEKAKPQSLVHEVETTHLVGRNDTAYEPNHDAHTDNGAQYRRNKPRSDDVGVVSPSLSQLFFPLFSVLGSWRCFAFELEPRVFGEVERADV